MKFSTREDIEVPVDDVFARIADFDTFERMALRHGAQVTRRDGPGPGTTWQVRADIRGKPREMRIALVRLDAPDGLTVDIASAGIVGALVVELVALSRSRTRMRVALEVRPQTLSARLSIQSARLARGTLTKRYKGRIAQFAREIETSHKRAPRT